MALVTKEDVEALADALTRNADESHARLMQAIQSGEIVPEQARAVFQQEILLRQHAAGLYVDAAVSVVGGLAVTQSQLIAVVDSAAKQMAGIRQVETFLDLLGDLLTLAAAAGAAKPKPILTALREVKSDLDNLGVQLPALPGA